MAAERPAGGGAWKPTPPKAPPAAPPASGGSHPPPYGPAPTGQGAAPMGAAGGTPVSKYSWAIALIQAMGGTPTPQIVNLIIAWINKEGTPASWNPLAITNVELPGSSRFNSVNVRNFVSLDQGVQATANFLLHGSYYHNIVAAIKSGDVNFALNHPNEFNTWGGNAGYAASLFSIYRNVSGDKNAGTGALIAAGGQGGSRAGGASSYILATDPSLEWALGVPELADLLNKAATEHWDDTKLTSALQSTDYYRSHSAQVRAWQALQGSDPATAARNLQAAEASLKALAASLGITMTDSALAGLAMGHMMFGWTSDEDRQHLLAAGAFAGSGTLGAVGDGAAQARQLFAQYGIKLDDATAQKYGLEINMTANVSTALENLRPIAIQQAKGLYPNLAELFDKGITAENVFASYRSDAAQLLGVDASTIDLTDPKWSRFLEGDNKGGMMNRQQARATITTDPTYHYDTTEAARNDAYALRDQLGEKLGVSA